jgi:D-lactate dehydrogenase
MNILILNDREPIDSIYLSELTEKHNVNLIQCPTSSFDLVSILKKYSNTDILVTTYMNLNQTNLALLPNLKAIVTTTTGMDFIDMDLCQKKKISVYNNPGYTQSAVAEHLLALMLASGRQLVGLDNGLKSGDFEQFGIKGFEFSGKTVGIVGFGSIGQRFATLVSGLGVNVQYYNRSQKTSPHKQVDFEQLVKTSDVIALSIPLVPMTHHLFDESVFAQMKKGSILVSIAADEVIDINALTKALGDGTLFAAGLDLHAPQSQLNQLSNVILTPTKAWYTKECMHRRNISWLQVLNRVINN